MAVFFFAVGLEIKREFLVSELADAREGQAPAAAIGGMVVPALCYAAFNSAASRCRSNRMNTFLRRIKGAMALNVQV